MSPVVFMGLALGMRHAVDPDHLAAIDGLTRIRPRAANGIFFALGHGLVVIALAVGIGRALGEHFAFLGPWSLIAIGAVNLGRLLRAPASSPTVRLVVAQPFLLGMLLAAGFETASQLSALVLAGRMNAWLIGSAFTAGMVIVDGADGYLAASTQQLAIAGGARANVGSRALGILVVVCAFGLGTAELCGVDLTAVAMPLGIALFAGILSIRVWVRTGGLALNIRRRNGEGEVFQ